MREVRKYSDEDKAQALELYAELGPRETHRQTGIPLGTLCTWATNAGLVLRTSDENTEAQNARITQKRELLKELLADKVVDLVERMDEPHVDFRGGSGTGEPHQVEFPKARSSDVRNYSIAAAVFIDKLLLLSGEATERHDYTADASVQRLSEILGVEPGQVADELARRRAAKRQAS